MASVNRHRKYHAFLILLMSLSLILNLPGSVSAETNNSHTEGAKAATEFSATGSVANSAFEFGGLHNTFTESKGLVDNTSKAANLPNSTSINEYVDSGSSQSVEHKLVLSQKDVAQSNQTPSSKTTALPESTDENIIDNSESMEQTSNSIQTEEAAIENENANDDSPESPSTLNNEKVNKDDDEDTPVVSSLQSKNGSVDNESSESTSITNNLNGEVEENNTLEVQQLPNVQAPYGAPAGNSQKIIEVKSFEELKQAIVDAGTEPTTIKITQSFTLTEALKIGSDQNITITSSSNENQGSNKVKPIGQDKIVLPTDKDDTIESRQKLVKDAKTKGENAIKATDLDKNPLPSIDVTIKRDDSFQGTLIQIEKDGNLTLGLNAEDPLFIDGNKNVTTSIKHGSFVDVYGTLNINGGILTGGNNNSDESAPIYIGNGGKFSMNGGRITSNKNISYGTANFNAAGAVYVDEGGEFTLNAGSIDNNNAPVGGVFLGRIFGNKSPDRKLALFTMNGGYIANNKGPMYSGIDSRTQYYGGGVHVDSLAKFIFNDGIIAGNASYHGGGIAITDNYINKFNLKYCSTNHDLYENYIKYAGAYYTQNGGLIYKNTAKLVDNNILTAAGGGLYINSSMTDFKGGYILNNKSYHEGGGIYVSSHPIKLTLEHTLITQNKAVNNGTQNQYSPGEGGGYWNCPVGDDIIQDYHSLYIFENEAVLRGADIHTGYKTPDYTINDKDKKFKTWTSPITEKGNIIKYKDDIRKDYPEWMYYTNEALNLKAYYDEATTKEAWTNSNLFIIGNESDRGGGIGSNADIFSPGNPHNNKVIIEKKWDKSIPEDKIPESIWVNIFIGDKKYAEVELKKSNNWMYQFENLPFTSEELAKLKLKYKFKERTDDFYSLVTESDKTQLEIERIWANYNYTYDPKPNDVNHSEKIIFIYKDKNGEEVSRENIKISNLKGDGKRWTALLDNKIFAGLKNLKNITIKYHSFYKPYKWQGYYGLDGNSDWNGSGPWHEAYVIEKSDGTIEVQLPYIWTQYLNNAAGRTQDYSKNKTGYQLHLVTNHTFTITNYPYSEIPVEKHWDKSIKKTDIPDSINVYLLKDGKRYVDENGKERVITLSKTNGWKGTFKKLPYFGIFKMGFENYGLEEDSKIFIPLVKTKEKPMIEVTVERVQRLDNHGYKIDDDNGDYPGGVYRVKAIPFEVQHGNSVDMFNVTFHSTNLWFKLWGDLKGEIRFLPDIEFSDEELSKITNIEIKTYYDENGNPFPRNLGNYSIRESEPPVSNPGAYILKLEKENGKLVLYVPKLTPSDWDENLLNVKARLLDEKQPYFEMTNYYLPKHRIEIEKIWNTSDSSAIPKNLKIKIKGKYVTKEITLKPEAWKYVEEFLGKGLLQSNEYKFTEEKLANFNGTHSIETSLEFEAKDKTVTFLDKDGKSIKQAEFQKLIKGKKYSFELKDLDAKKAEVQIKYDVNGNLVIVYPIDVTVTEVAKVRFTNTEKPPVPPEEPPTPPEEPPVPPEEPPSPPEPPVPPEQPPQTGSTANGDILGLLALGFLGLYVTKRRKRSYCE